MPPASNSQLSSQKSQNSTSTASQERFISEIFCRTALFSLSSGGPRMHGNPKVLSQHKVSLTLLEHVKKAWMSLITDLFMMYMEASIRILLHFCRVLLVQVSSNSARIFHLAEQLDFQELALLTVFAEAKNESSSKLLNCPLISTYLVCISCLPHSQIELISPIQLTVHWSFDSSTH